MKMVYIFLIFLVSAVIAGIPWVPEPSTHIPLAGTGPWMFWHNSLVNYSRDHYDQINVLFYGDSITWLWFNEGRELWDNYYASLGAANYGIPGDRTEHVLWRIQNGEVIPQMHPKVCVLMIGTNNLDYDDDPLSIATGITVVVSELRRRLPDMKILLLGLLPRTDEETTKLTSAVNQLIKFLDSGNTVRFLDMSSRFYSGGENFNRELYVDMLHLSEAGFGVWAQVMDPLFREILDS